MSRSWGQTPFRQFRVPAVFRSLVEHVGGVEDEHAGVVIISGGVANDGSVAGIVRRHPDNGNRAVVQDITLDDAPAHAVARSQRKTVAGESHGS